jgi:hypothetical protein
MIGGVRRQTLHALSFVFSRYPTVPFVSPRFCIYNDSLVLQLALLPPVLAPYSGPFFLLRILELFLNPEGYAASGCLCSNCRNSESIIESVVFTRRIRKG